MSAGGDSDLTPSNGLAEATQFRRRTRHASFWAAIKKAPPSAWFGLVVVALYILVAVFAPALAPYGETEVVGPQYEQWNDQFVLGTDQLGRDMLSRLIYGARNSVGIALVTTLLSFAMGCTLGILAAVMGGWIEMLSSRFVDVLMAIPSLIFALLLLSLVGPSILNLILIIAVLDATRIFRLSRAVAMNVVVMDFVEAARLQGEKLPWVMVREVLPNIMPPLIAEFGLRFIFVFLTVASLSFLGLGVQPPAADWGAMVRENATLISFGDITPLLPAAAIAVLAVAVNFIVDWFLHKTSGLRDDG
jgi:peptide/nickel transport system permease protein